MHIYELTNDEPQVYNHLREKLMIRNKEERNENACSKMGS